MDRTGAFMDVIGAAGLALVTTGVWELAGWAWASILVGAVLVGVYTVREIRTIVRG